MSRGGFSEVKVPFAAFHSANDNLTDIEGTEALMSGSNPRNGDKVFYRVGEGLDINVRYAFLCLYVCVCMWEGGVVGLLWSTFFFLFCAILYCVDLRISDNVHKFRNCSLLCACRPHTIS